MPSSSSKPPIRVGLVGGGTVGGGVYELVMGRLRNDPTTGITTTRGHHRPLVITKVCVKDLSKPRTFHLDDSLTTMTNNLDTILDDPDIDMIVEVMGGTDLAKTVVETSLLRRKMVVTANPALLADQIDPLQRLVRETKGALGYEAAVCGGIPIIHTLKTCYMGDVIHHIQGICSGTTNYILEKMAKGGGIEYEAALQEAQELGFAETDPTADVQGWSVRDKMCIMAKLAFGATVPPASVPCQGIEQLQSADFEYAQLLGTTIKLLGSVQRLHKAREWDGPLCVYVSPVMIPNDHLLASIPSNGNAVAVTSANLGTCCYTGPGAGRYPTANSIVADMVRLADGKSKYPPFPLQENLELDFDYASPFYIRIPYADGLGIIKIVGELAEEAGVSIHSILQNPIRDRMSADFVVTTEEVKLSQVTSFCESIDQRHEFCLSQCVFMPMLIEL